LTLVLGWLAVPDKCALGACSAAYRRRLHAARLGLIPQVFGPYASDVFTGGLLSPYDYFAHFAAVLLPGPREMRRPRQLRATLLLEEPIAPEHFYSLAEWQRYHFGHHPIPRPVDSVYRLPLKFRIGSPARYRSLKALIF
jgi:hypothetical protein